LDFDDLVPFRRPPAVMKSRHFLRQRQRQPPLGRGQGKRRMKPKNRNSRKTKSTRDVKFGPRPRRNLRDETEAKRCRGTAETKTDKKMPRGCLDVRQLPRGLHLWQPVT